MMAERTAQRFGDEAATVQSLTVPGQHSGAASDEHGASPRTVQTRRSQRHGAASVMPNSGSCAGLSESSPEQHARSRHSEQLQILAAAMLCPGT
jgi:hypothetical protein